MLAMLEKVYNFSTDDAKHIEQLIDDDPVMINHIILPKGERLPEHYSNSNTYMVVIRGKLTLKLNEQEPHVYTSGKIVNIPYKIKMNVSNQNDQILEFFVVKAPNPRNYNEA
jgi:quercetin dioxygenase-like cupin family protein